MKEQKLFWIKNYADIVLNEGTNDQIMPRFRRSLMNNKRVFKYV